MEGTTRADPAGPAADGRHAGSTASTASTRPEPPSTAWWVAAVVPGGLLLVLSVMGVTSPRAALSVLAAGLLGAMVVTLLAWRASQARLATHEEALIGWARQRAAQEERLRVARDLHDLASHGLGLITLRAAAARTVQGPDADAERSAALADIERAARTATTELRRMVAVLRSPEDALPPDGSAPLVPQATLADLPSLVDAARATGVETSLELLPGLVDTLSGGAQATVCLVVREALANVARHAGPTRASVVVAPLTGAAGVHVEVRDAGAVQGWRPHPGTGHGLVGLRERVGALGGTFTAGPVPGGFALTASIPEEAGVPAVTECR